MKNGVTQVPRVALITGSARRIGASIARLLHANGFKVAIHYRHSESEAKALCEELNSKYGDSAKAFKADLLEVAQHSRLIQEVVAWQGHLNVLVNNASVFYAAKISQVDEAHWDELFSANLKAPYFLAKYAYPYLKQKQGCIINITDIHGNKPLSDYSVYCMTKAALIMQTKALAKEMAPHVRVNAIAPGAIAWPEGSNQLDELQQQKIIDKTLLKTHGKPSYIAQAVLAMIDNPFITGQNLCVDGGR